MSAVATATGSVIAMVAYCVTALLVIGWKPGADAVTSYSPAGRAEPKLNCPCASVVAV